VRGGYTTITHRARILIPIRKHSQSNSSVVLFADLNSLVDTRAADVLLYKPGFFVLNYRFAIVAIDELSFFREIRSILPEFVMLYEKDSQGKLKDEYEPLRMAVQLYEQAYAISYWKARHILWWSAIEALYGNNEDAAMARIYALFGEKNLVDGYRCSVCEAGDIPSCYYPSSSSMHTLGKMVPLIYEVRNASAHGQKVPDSHFNPVAHPFGETVGVDALAEAATFIIRKTVAQILERRLRDKFRDRDTREDFWLYEYGLDKHQSKKRLRQMNEVLEGLPSPEAY
jgi:hypothetical protein